MWNKISEVGYPDRVDKYWVLIVDKETKEEIIEVYEYREKNWQGHELGFGIWMEYDRGQQAVEFYPENDFDITHWKEMEIPASPGNSVFDDFDSSGYYFDLQDLMQNKNNG